MNRYSLVVLVVACAVLLASVQADEEKKEEGKKEGGKKRGWGDIKCKGKPFKDADKAKEEKKKLYKECAKGANSTADSSDKRKMWRDPCFHLCKLKKEGIISSEGKYVKEKAHAATDKHFPDEVKEEAKKGVDECAEKHGKDFKADDCKTYSKFMGCQRHSMMKVCGWEGMRKGGKGKGKKEKKPAEDAEGDE